MVATRQRNNSSVGDLENIINNVLEKHPDLRRKVEKNPEMYRPILEKTVSEVYEQYKGPIYWGKTVDHLDRIIAVGGLAADAASGGTASAIKDAAELAPKAAYAAYYLYKTRDYGALPGWLANEAVSFIPYVGELADIRKSYFNRAQKRFASVVKKRFLERISSLNN